MPYLNLDLDYFDHPKTKRLVGLLGRGSDVLPVRLWSYCGKYHADTGHLIGYSPTELETAIGWWGQPGRAVEALLRPFQDRPGFLERLENGFKVHDWDKVNGHIAAFKARAQAGAAEKWRRVKEQADAQAMLKQSLSNATSNALTSLTSSEDQEKRRRRCRTVLAHVDPDNLPPARPDPDNLEATKKTIRPKRHPKTLISEDWQIPAVTVSWCAEKGLPEPEYQLPMFINHWQSKGEARADWVATFRNWMLSPYRKDRINAKDGSGRANSQPYQSAADKRESANTEFLRDLEARRDRGANPEDVHLGSATSPGEGILHLET